MFAFSNKGDVVPPGLDGPSPPRMCSGASQSHQGYVKEVRHILLSDPHATRVEGRMKSGQR